MVREYVATRRREIRVEVGREPANAFIPQEHLPGREAEVDFGDVAIRLRGELVTCALFSLRLSYSGKAVHRVSASAGQEAFFEVTSTPSTCSAGCRPGDPLRQPQGRRRERDQVLPPAGRGRQVDRRPFHYGIEAFYCQPGIQGAHEKGGVEGRSAGSDATTSSPSPKSTPSPSSTLWSTPGTKPTTPGGSGPAPARSGNASPPSSHSSRFRPSRSRPAAGSPRAWTGTPRSRSG